MALLARNRRRPSGRAQLHSRRPRYFVPTRQPIWRTCASSTNPAAETPYVVRTTVGVSKSESWPATIRENSFVPDKYTQLVLDLGVYPRFHNAVRLDTPETDFILWVEVDASDDARTWRIVKMRAPISRFRKEGLEGNQTIHYSENNARYLRVQIRESANQFPVTGGGRLSFFSIAEGCHPAAVDFSAECAQSRYRHARRYDDVDARPRKQRTRRSIRSTSQPVGRNSFAACGFPSVPTAKNGHRPEVERIYRYVGDSRREESLRVPVYGYPGVRYWRVEILNGNDSPLANVQLSASMVPRLILFRPAAGHSYRLAYGNEKRRHRNMTSNARFMSVQRKKPFRIHWRTNRKTTPIRTRGHFLSATLLCSGLRWP